MVNNFIFILTSVSIFVVVYHHLIYPILLNYLSRLPFARKLPYQVVKEANTDADLPSITLVIPAYNEERWIGEKLLNLAIQDYPTHLFKVIVICDGCTDNTVRVAKKIITTPLCQHLNVKIEVFEKNQGKVAILNQIMAKIDTDIVGFSDVSALLSIDALRLAAEQFQIPNVGVVNSHYCLGKGYGGERKYWKYQNHIIECEAKLGSALGAHGALYFIRRSLFSSLAPDTINDDFILPMSIVGKGYHACLHTNINAVELEATNKQNDFKRRCRIGAGNFQQLIRLFKCLHPRLGFSAFTFASGKALRALMPFFMIFAWFGSFYLSFSYTFFLFLFLGQSSIYICVALSYFSIFTIKYSFFTVIYYLVMGHYANLIGTLNYLYNKKSKI